MKDNKIIEDGYIPYDGNLVDIIYPLNNYFYTYGIKTDIRGNRKLDSKNIVISKRQIRVNCSFFKHDKPLLQGLYELPIEGREDILLMIIQGCQDMITKIYTSLSDKRVVLIDDCH